MNLPIVEEYLLMMADAFRDAQLRFSSFRLPTRPEYPFVVALPFTLTPTGVSFQGGKSDDFAVQYNICSTDGTFQETLRTIKQIKDLLDFKDFVTNQFEYCHLFPTITFVYDEEALQTALLDYTINVNHR